MGEQQALRVTGFPRALALFILLAGIVIMHSAVFAVGHGAHGAASVETHGAVSHESPDAIAPALSDAVAPTLSNAVVPALSDAVVPVISGAVAHLSTGAPEARGHGAPGAEHDHALPAANPPEPALLAAQSGDGQLTQNSGCPDGGCDTSGGVHGCVFVLTVLGLALALAVLYWVGVTRRYDLPVRLPWRRIRRARPPPWTVPTLADLAILRI
ncbi:hypothetical protein [Nocardia sp. NPDC050406]|uniref:hypothetical protein n=1 Tax=Nocardia sp. NPDC050406 TaxID=3364318 RepID=UPI0037BB7ED1